MMGPGSQVRQLASLWGGVAEAGEAELDEVRELTGALCARPDASAGMLSAAWRLSVDIEHALGLPHSDRPELARARSAAVSARHASSLLLGELQEALRTAKRPVVVFSELAACWRLFGRCDVVPPRGAVIMPPFGGDHNGLAGTAIPVHNGVRWGTPGRLAPFLAEGLEEVDVEGCCFDLPPIDVMTARLATQAAEGGETCGLLFVAAVEKCKREGRWDRAQEIIGRVKAQVALRRALSRWQVPSDGDAPSNAFNVLRFVRRMLRA